MCVSLILLILLLPLIIIVYYITTPIPFLWSCFFYNGMFVGVKLIEVAQANAREAEEKLDKQVGG